MGYNACMSLICLLFLKGRDYTSNCEIMDPAVALLAGTYDSVMAPFLVKAATKLFGNRQQPTFFYYGVAPLQNLLNELSSTVSVKGLLNLD